MLVKGAPVPHLGPCEQAEAQRCHAVRDPARGDAKHLLQGPAAAAQLVTAAMNVAVEAAQLAVVCVDATAAALEWELWAVNR